jgi:hypothetical protein
MLLKYISSGTALHGCAALLAMHPQNGGRVLEMSKGGCLIWPLDTQAGAGRAQVTHFCHCAPRRWNRPNEGVVVQVPTEAVGKVWDGAVRLQGRRLYTCMLAPIHMIIACVCMAFQEAWLESSPAPHTLKILVQG